MDGTHAATPRHIDEGVFGTGVIGFWRPNGLSARIALIAAASVNCVIFGWGTQIFGIPQLPKYDGSLLLQASPFAAFVVIAVLLFAATLTGTFLAGAVRFEAGLFAAALGMTVVSLRAGTMQSVLFESGGNEAVFTMLAVELAALGIMFGAMWAFLWGMGRAEMVRVPPDELHAEVHADAPDEHPEDMGLTGKFAATFTQVIATAVLIMFLCQTDAKDQVLASVAIASICGTLVSYLCFPTRPSVWYWMGPPIVGLIGYLIAASGQDSMLAIGTPVGPFGALARPLPIDYASVGVAGAILGYWLARRKNSDQPL